MTEKLRDAMTVLIVEDNEGVRRLLRRTVAEIASDVWECSDGIDSLEAYTVHQPDIVLMDVRMPKMDGLTATRLILKSHSAARIVMVTDYIDESIHQLVRQRRPVFGRQIRVGAAPQPAAHDEIAAVRCDGIFHALFSISGPLLRGLLPYGTSPKPLVV